MKGMFLTLLFIVLASSCSKSPKTAEGLLRVYINDLVTKDVGLEYHLERTTGELRESIEMMDPDDFERSEAFAHVNRVDVKILHRNCSENECVLTYTVGYEFNKNEDIEVDSFNENRKLAKLVKEGNQWRIAEITNIKTYIDIKEPINPLIESSD